jgi:hypothetical protein
VEAAGDNPLEIYDGFMDSPTHATDSAGNEAMVLLGRVEANMVLSECAYAQARPLLWSTRRSICRDSIPRS